MKLARTKEWRESHGLTQRELAAEASVGEVTVARIESGASVAPPTARKIAEALDVSVADLMERPPVPLGDAPPETGPGSLQFEDERLFMISYADGTHTWDEAWAEAREYAKDARGEYGSKVTVRDDGEAVEVFVERGVTDRIRAARDRAIRDDVKRAGALDRTRGRV